MRIVLEELADVAEARAYQLGDTLIVRVAGKKPTTCHLVTVERALTDVEPPAFVVRMAIDPRARCRTDLPPVDFDVVQGFRVGTAREEVLVHHAGGELAVPVTAVAVEGEGDGAAEGDAPAMGARSTGTSPRPRPPLLPQPEPSEAVGYSRDYDLGEAIKDAIRQLPDQAPGFNDWLSTYTVVSIGAQVGGIAGFDHLVVTVRG